MDYFSYQIDLFFELVIFQFKMIFLYWIGGVILGSLISVFAADVIVKMAEKLKSDKFSIIKAIFAALLGAASPICMYGTIPLIASLGRRGLPQYILASFMITSILINPNLFMFSFALGVPLAVCRLIVSVLAGVLAGLLVYLLFKNKSLFNYEGFEGRNKKPAAKNLRTFLSDLNRGIVKTAPYFLFGILFTALFQVFFPAKLMSSIFRLNEGLGVLLGATLGVPLYLCGGGTIPFLKAWLDAGMSPGSAISFMISGAATKLTNLSAVKIILGVRNFILYLAFNIIFAIAAGWLADLFFHIT